MKHFQLGIASLALLTGCVDELGDEEEVSETFSESISTNGVSLNGISLNGISLNGISLNGISLNGISLNGISLNGTSLNGSTLNGTTLTSTTLSKSVGSKWTGTLSNGTSLAFRIDSATKGTGTNADVGMYGISYQADGTWKPLCGAGVLAVAVPGTWSATAAYAASTTQLTFACRGKAIAKCVELGYKPWKGRTTQLASCTRMLRGDYCGTGVAYTVDGQQVNVIDNVGLQADAAAWDREAEWKPTGASCITGKRQTRFSQTGTTMPACWGGTLKTTSTCANGFTAGAVLISELPPIVNTTMQLSNSNN
jgi:hypothetical protein